LNTDRFPALANRNFLIFWVGQFISLVGTWMQSTVQPYLAYRITGQPIYLGLIGFSASLPALLITLPSGVLVEHLDKRKTVIVMQAVMMVQAFFLAYLVFSGQITIWWIVGLSFLLGVANSVEIIARQSMIVDLVGKEALPNAIALNSAIFNAARVLGPSLAAPFMVFIQGSGEGWAFFANGASYLFVIVGLFMIRLQKQTRLETPPGLRQGLIDFREGQKYILATPYVALLILTVTIPGIFGFPFAQQIPVFAKNVLAQIGDTTATVAARNSLLVTFQGVGALIAAVYLSVFSGIRRKNLLLTIGQFVFAGALVAISFSKVPFISYFIIVMLGWGMITQLALTNTLIQLAVPDHFRGRVMGTYIWAMNGVAPFGSLLIGGVAQTFGAPVAILFGGSVCLIGYLIMAIVKTRLKQKRLADVP
jgi:MFS family permease